VTIAVSDLSNLPKRSIRHDMGRRAASRSVSRRDRAQRGAVMTETAIIVAIVLVPLVFGLLEFGLLYKDVLTVENGTRAGARTGAAAANQANADRQIIDSVMNGMASLPAGAVKKVVVYASTAANGTVPEICKTQSDAASRCNHYSGAVLTGGAADDSKWPASTRINQSQANVDYLGVWVQIEHAWVTGFFGSSRTVSDHVVMRLEPTPRLKPPPPPPTTTTIAAPTTTTTTTTTPTTTSWTSSTTTSSTSSTTTTTAKPATTTTTAAPTTTTAIPTTTVWTMPPQPPRPPSRG
jgi:Flp pilus assembly protein TadG